MTRDADNRGRYFLKSLRIDAFGDMYQRTVGPFTPGLNVIYGQNEAGKTTVASFINGVLFGWEEARGRRNVYRPASMQRSGTLVFASEEGENVTVRASRSRNADGIIYDSDIDLLSDVDGQTYGTVFSLDSDELRKLAKTNDMTAGLLTAGSGTSVLPARALEQVDRKISACLSRSANHPDSIPNCNSELDDVRARLAEARKEMELYKREDREFKELGPQMERLQVSLAKTNREVEALSAQQQTLLRLEEEAKDLFDRQSQLDAEESEIDLLADSYWSERDERVPFIDAVEERTLRDSIDEMMESRNRIENMVSLARSEYASSKALHDALVQAADDGGPHKPFYRRHSAQLIASVATPFILALMGIPVFSYGRELNSLSITIVGLLLVFSALTIALVAVIFTLLGSNSGKEGEGKRLEDARWVAIQDENKLKALLEQQEAYELKVRQSLDSSGLQAAEGDLRRARALLDEAARARNDWAVLDQRRRSLSSQRVFLEERKEKNEKARIGALEAVGLSAQDGLDMLEDRLRRRQLLREDQMHTSASYNARFGELKRELSSARHMFHFDDLKLCEQTLLTRLHDTTQEYARLLLTRRLLELSMASWEAESQPKVYQCASRLFGRMTGGKWSKVHVDGRGDLQVVDAFDMVRDPLLLSMGTCQQLYLAMRIALLLVADNVGRNVPVLADDILVNFDDDRRRGAACALADLAAHRQVVVFTCHDEVVRLMQESCSQMNLIRL